MEYEIYRKWVRVSFRWVRNEETDQGLPHHIQMLGIEDAELRGVRKEDLFDENGRPIEDEHGLLLLERYQIKAHLWVLGVYEFIRMVAQRVREDNSLTTADAFETIKTTKKLYERVRIPLAKLEPAQRHKKTDFSVAYAGIGPDGLAWKVSENVIISQEELSDAFYKMMVSLRPNET